MVQAAVRRNAQDCSLVGTKKGLCGVGYASGCVCWTVFPPPELSTCSCVSLRWRFCLLSMWKSLHIFVSNSFFFEASDCRVKNKPQLISSTECHWAFVVCLGFNTCIFVVWTDFLCCFVWRVQHKVRQHLVKSVIGFKELEVATS